MGSKKLVVSSDQECVNVAEIWEQIEWKFCNLVTIALDIRKEL